MKVQQVSVFMANRAGRMAEIAKILGENNINIRALSIADTTDFGILRLIVSDVEKAENVLKDAGLTVSLTPVVAIEIPDHPGGLAHVLENLQNAGMNIEYLYAFVEKSGDKAVVVFRFDDIDAALRAIEKGGVHALSAEQIYTL